MTEHSAEARDRDPYAESAGLFLMLAAFGSGLWMTVGLPAIMIVLAYSVVAVWEFSSRIAAGPDIATWRWVMASLVLILGLLAHACYLAGLTQMSTSKAQLRLAMLMAAPALLLCLLIAIPLLRCLVWCLEWTGWTDCILLFSEGPTTFGQAIGIFAGIVFWPLLLCSGIAKAVLLAGYPSVELGCGLLQQAAAAGLIDTSSLFRLAWELTTLLMKPELLKALGFEIVKPFYDLNWASTLTLGSGIEYGAEALTCYISGALDKPYLPTQ